jgi:hypothetical protein
MMVIFDGEVIDCCGAVLVGCLFYYSQITHRNLLNHTYGVMKHKHHIIPKHMNGSSDPSNIISLSVEEHAEAHRILWEEHGKTEDFMAWKMLSGKTEEAEEARIVLAKNGFQTFLLGKSSLSWKKNISASLKGIKQSSETTQKRSDSLKLAWTKGHFADRKPIDLATLRENYNGEAMAEGRKNSAKWKESVTSDSYKLKKSAADPRSREVVVNGVTYFSIRLAAKGVGIPYSRLRSLLDGKNFLTLLDL